MARSPFQVLVLPFAGTSRNSYAFAVFRRSDGDYWQGIAGGGEAGEDPIDAARREGWEEGGIDPHARYYRLQCQTTIPVAYFAARKHWPENLYVIPGYCFAVAVENRALTLSPEHTEVRWVPFEEARALLHWDSNKTALWELHERLRRSDLPPMEPYPD